jgi:hypothetical protein
MPLNSELIESARSAGTTFEEAERQALLARAEYHTAIRRLHLAGGSLREIAHSLSLSHQRVQQIVSGAGGTWWSRVWRTRRVGPDAVCTWCGRPPSEVAKLVAGPRVYICDACIEAAEKVANGRRSPSDPFMGIKKTSAAATCAFCGKRAQKPRALVTGRAANVCTDCLRTCRDIVDAKSA